MPAARCSPVVLARVEVRQSWPRRPKPTHTFIGHTVPDEKPHETYVGVTITEHPAS